MCIRDRYAMGARAPLPYAARTSSRDGAAMAAAGPGGQGADRAPVLDRGGRCGIGRERRRW
eukprot:2614191-Pyramimonas_sp.AAC.1